MYVENNPDGKDSYLAYADMLALAQNLCDRSEGATWSAVPFEDIDLTQRTRRELRCFAAINIHIVDTQQKVEGELLDIVNAMLALSDTFDAEKKDDGVHLIFGMERKLIWQNEEKKPKVKKLFGKPIK